VGNVKRNEVVESGFKVTVPPGTTFRFCECEAYRRLSGLGLREMDVGWCETDGSKLTLLELKGQGVWRGFEQGRDSADRFLIEKIGGKATDALLMLASVWAGTRVGTELAACLPKCSRKYPGDGALRLVFLIDTPASRWELLLAVKDRLNRRLGGRVRLFGIGSLALVDYETARRIGLPVQRQL